MGGSIYSLICALMLIHFVQASEKVFHMNQVQSYSSEPLTHVQTSTSDSDTGECIWYGQCGDVGRGQLNCNYTGPAKNLTDPDSQSILRQICPYLFTKGQAWTMTCCDADQIKTLNDNLKLASQLISRCPACMSNFFSMFCHMTCDPHQSRYLKAKKMLPSTDKDPKSPFMVSDVGYTVSDRYANGMYNSCLNVQGAGGQLAITSLCNTDPQHCTPLKLLTYLGDTNANPNTPIQIDFNIVSSNGSMNATTTPCNVSCSCQDCSTACPPVPPPVIPHKFQIFGIDGMYFIMGCSFLAFLILFGSGSFWCIHYTKEPDTQRPPVDDNDLITADPTFTTNGHSHNDRASQKIITSADVSCREKLGCKVDDLFERMFCSWGLLCAKHPFIIIILSIIFCGTLSAGIVKFQVTTDPVELWSSPKSRARQEKNYYDDNFTPFYRTEMLIIEPKDKSQWLRHDSGSSTQSQLFGAALRKDFLKEVLELQTMLASLTVYSSAANRTISLEDICFAPLLPENKNCTIQSVLNYYQNSVDVLNKVHYKVDPIFGTKTLTADYIDHFVACTRNPESVDDGTDLHVECLGSFGGPVDPRIALGGFPTLKSGQPDYENATVLVVTFLVNNFKNDTYQKMAADWEEVFIDAVRNYSNPNFTISFMAERSIQDELNRESRSDVFTILISYLIMFGYVSITLGQFKSFSRILIDSKIFLGLAGVIIVLISVVSSIGFYSYIGVNATLIIIEVVPFLVLAVGVDNIFILVQTYQRSEGLEGMTVEEQVSRVVGKVGPSMFLTSCSESLAFFLAGTLTNMPAVKAFSFYASTAVFIDFLLQISCFVSLLTFDSKRQQSNRPECCCCVKCEPNEVNDSCWPSKGFLYTIFKNYYTEFILNKYVRPIVVVIFTGWLCVCIAVVGKVGIGLDQKLSMPQDSYVLDYFDAEQSYISIGPPVYFVVEGGHNYTNVMGQNQICGAQGCPEHSLLGQVYQASRMSKRSYIQQPAMSWLDDYIAWLNIDDCCRQYKNGSFCSAAERNQTCKHCNVTDVSDSGRPIGQSFTQFLPWFLEDNPCMQCAKGGHAAYGSLVKYYANTSTIGATAFMTYHTVLKTNSDFIEALRNARELGDNITHTINTWNTSNEKSLHHDLSGTGWSNLTQKIFPYSKIYVFYEQYLTIAKDTWMNLVICISAILFMTFILMGFDLWTAFAVCFIISMIVMSMLGMMFFWDITLNAVSLVNLIMTVGISVEFCSHTARAFAVSTKPTRILRAKDSLAHMGSSVLSGITLTKLGGIVVLAFSKSQLFQVFYFRMYLGIVVFGAAHGLIYLPVFLSYLGPPLNKAMLLKQQQKQFLHVSASPSEGELPHSDQQPIIQEAYMGEENPPNYNNIYPDQQRTFGV